MPQPAGPRLADVARLAEVGIGTASAVLNGKAVVAEATRARALAAVEKLGCGRGRPAGALAPHRRRNGFGTWLFQPAATGRYPAKAPRPIQPRPRCSRTLGQASRSAGDVRQRRRSPCCWLPIALGLTPHGLRHLFQGEDDRAGDPAALMGHEDGSVQALCSHVTPEMIRRLLDGLTALWTALLEARRRLSPRSPVAVLDRLLAECGTDDRQIPPRSSPSGLSQRETGSARHERNPF
ncbi:LacI family DNA-binding transcriptional regulator [Actinoplanes sp. NPDC051475]|uniref:LacI family DNA-binding transcriptional regulator n=1 Tax=Actinoplanes sp. NPDC051475 TaxID=3157225 RepID=UPI00344E7E9A